MAIFDREVCDLPALGIGSMRPVISGGTRNGDTRLVEQEKMKSKWAELRDDNMRGTRFYPKAQSPIDHK